MRPESSPTLIMRTAKGCKAWAWRMETEMVFPALMLFSARVRRCLYTVLGVASRMISKLRKTPMPAPMRMPRYSEMRAIMEVFRMSLSTGVFKSR